MVMHTAHSRCQSIAGKCRWSVKLKAMCQGHADASLLHETSAEQLAQKLPVAAEVAAPQGPTSAAKLHQEQFAVLEVGLLQMEWDVHLDLLC